LHEFGTQALGTQAPVPEHRVAPSALRLCEVGIEGRTLPVPSRPFDARHLTNHESTRSYLHTYVFELRLAGLSCSFLHYPHCQSLVADTRFGLATRLCHR
jgi:hypothetical protein